LDTRGRCFERVDVVGLEEVIGVELERFVRRIHLGTTSVCAGQRRRRRPLARSWTTKLGEVERTRA
jgi:hypothetical protein